MPATYSWRLQRRLIDPVDAVEVLYQFARFGARLEARLAADDTRRMAVFVLCGAQPVATLRRLQEFAPGTQWEATQAYESQLPEAPEAAALDDWLR